MPAELRGDRWHVRCQIDGRKYRQSLGKGSTREDAEALEREIRRKALEWKLTPPHERRRGPGIKPKDYTKIHYVYRHFDGDGRLLYIGVSLSGLSRLLGHMSASEWGHAIRAVTLEPHPNRAAALEAEAKAIVAERPLHNQTIPVLVANGRRQTDAARFIPDTPSL